VHLVLGPKGSVEQPAHDQSAERDVNQCIQKYLSFVIVELSKCVVRRPWTTLFIEVLITLICFAGIFSPNMVFESKAENLWVPTVSFLNDLHMHFQAAMISLVKINLSKKKDMACVELSCHSMCPLKSNFSSASDTLYASL